MYQSQYCNVIFHKNSRNDVVPETGLQWQWQGGFSSSMRLLLLGRALMTLFRGRVQILRVWRVDWHFEMSNGGTFEIRYHFRTTCQHRRSVGVLYVALLFLTPFGNSIVRTLHAARLDAHHLSNDVDIELDQKPPRSNLIKDGISTAMASPLYPLSFPHRRKSP